MNEIKCFILKFFTLEKIGLIFNLIGTLMIAFSFGKNLGDAYQKNSKGQKIYLASFLSPNLFRAGLLLLSIGFLLQLLSF